MSDDLKNYETEAAWQYHNGTKHPNGPLLSKLHTYNPASRPCPYKRYKNAPQIKLLPDKSPGIATALDAISSQESDSGVAPDIRLLSKILFFSNGITKTIRFPTLGEVEFRAASCTGALYHIETYVICSDMPGLAAGVYHFDPKDNALTILRKGDYRKVLVNATAGESFVSRSPVTLVFTDVFARNSIKYQAREYRHAFWDCGTILSNSLAVSSAGKIPYRLVLGFVDSEINELLGLDRTMEASLALLSIGQSRQEIPEPPPFAKVPDSEPVEHGLEFSAINEMHEASSLASKQEVSLWRGVQSLTHQPSLKRIKLADDLGTDESLEQTIIRRGSTRRFSHDSISFEQLSTILHSSTLGINSDFEDRVMSDVYLIINSVEGLVPGSYYYCKDDNSLVLLQEGNLRDVSGHLGLDQSLPYDASAAIFFMVDLDMVLQKFGNRGYRAAQLDASITAGKMYLASYALKVGATGLTFYDDEVTEFFSPHASNKSVMFMLAVGKRAERRD